MRSCDVLLALIGPSWLTVADRAGRRRLDKPDDLVRLEIVAALGRPDVLVIPVLVGGTAMPAAADLPEPLAALAACNEVRFSDEGWDDQVARLIRAVERVVKPRVVAPLPPVGRPPMKVKAEVIGAARTFTSDDELLEFYVESYEKYVRAESDKAWAKVKAEEDKKARAEAEQQRQPGRERFREARRPGQAPGPHHLLHAPAPPRS